MVKPSSFTYRMETHQHHNPTQDPDLDTKQNLQNQPQVWGTWEELLLASAVNRHGSKDWDAVAMEVQSRTNLPNLHATARHCEQKFHDLSRRFAVPTRLQNGAAAGNDDADHVPWLEELRKLRVAELRREVQRSDVSILSLQLKVKKLEEEREKDNDGKVDDKPDLVVSGEPRPGNDGTGGERVAPEQTSSEPEIRRLDESTTNTDKLLPTTGDESDRENQSVNESNSTGSRFEGGKTGESGGKSGLGTAPVHSGPKEPDPGGKKGKPVGEESNNGSYDTVAKVPTCESLPPSEERKAEGDSSELRGDSVGHSGEGGGTTRESSEVQSSASLTGKRKMRRRKEIRGGGDGGGGGGEVAPENDDVMVKSEPLIGVLDTIKGHEHSSLFERRLESQESDRYRNIVKQHMDLDTIQSRLQKGHYSSCTSTFFRDLLLLFTNATVFFPKNSSETKAAQQLRCLVMAEMKNCGRAQSSDPSPQKTDSLPPKRDSLFSKHKASTPILVCRKRSSISGKPSSGTLGQKGDHDKKERPSSDAKPPLKPSSSDTDEEDEPPPKIAKEKPVTGARSLRRSNKNLSNHPANRKTPSNSNLKGGSSANKPAEAPKPDKGRAEGGQDKKRNAAADFLKRIKKTTPVEALRSGGGGGGGGGGSSSSSRGGGGAGGGGGGAIVKDQKKVVNSGKGDNNTSNSKGKERASRNVGGGGGPGSGDNNRRNKNVENSSSSKRSVGRPPKKAAESNAVSAKRGRESSTSAAKDKRPKKRSKK